MTELSFSRTSNKKNNNELFSNMFNLCFSVFSQPLYFSYFLFFSLTSSESFLFSHLCSSPQPFFSLLHFSHSLPNQEKLGGSEISESRLDFLRSVFQTHVAAWLLSKADDNKDEEIGYLAEFEAYLVMFQASIFEAFDPKPVEEEDGSEEGSEAAHEGREVFISITEENKVVEEATVAVAEVKSLESLFQENSEFLEDDVFCQKQKKEVKEVDIEIETNKVEESERRWSFRNGSKVEHKSQQQEAILGSPNNLGGFGSMRVEKEWRRTLACKLFEERHNANGSDDGMDMLWETYETESNKVVLKKSSTKKTKKAEIVLNEKEEDEDEDEDEMEGKLCCLQALKFSAGKMNLGMGRPSLVKFSKALKGIGLFHHVGKHGKKG